MNTGSDNFRNNNIRYWNIQDYCLKSKRNNYKINSFFKWVFIEFIPIRAIWHKIRPPLEQGNIKRKPATILLYITGIYIALFGVASQRYENIVDIIENRANSIFAQLGTSNYKKALQRIPAVQNMSCPIKPDVKNPYSVFRSLLSDSNYTVMVELLKNVVEDYKESLDGIDFKMIDLEECNLTRSNFKNANLWRANFRNAMLTESNFENASLVNADLQNAILEVVNMQNVYLTDANLRSAQFYKSNFRNAKLYGTILEKAKLGDTIFIGANLMRADLQEASLFEANLEGANLLNVNLRKTNLAKSKLKSVSNLKIDQLCLASSLFEAELDQEIQEQVQKICPELLKNQ
jgi:uncharacterized protein YjbI with pentapeptide repeats